MQRNLLINCTNLAKCRMHLTRYQKTRTCEFAPRGFSSNRVEVYVCHTPLRHTHGRIMQHHSSNWCKRTVAISAWMFFVNKVEIDAVLSKNARIAKSGFTQLMLRQDFVCTEKWSMLYNTLV